MKKIAVIGSGSWGMALALLLSDNAHEVTVWSAVPEEIEELKTKHEHRTLPGIKMPESMILTTELSEAVSGKDILVLAVPSIYTRNTAAKMAPFYRNSQIIVSVAKGIEEGTLKTLSEQIEEEIPGAQVCVLSGPSHAEEVSRHLPTVCVAGAHKKEIAERIQDVFMSPVFRVYISPDILGMQIGGAVKNVIALAAGIADGLGYGDNTKAALITRGIAEMTRLGVSMGAKQETFAGLTGMGDLIVTCASMHSRNRRAGILIGKGYTFEAAMKEVNQVVEGVYSAKAALMLAEKYHTEMPIVREVNKILFSNKPPKQAVDDLMQRNPVSENKQLKWQL